MIVISYTVYDHPTDYPDKFVIRRFDNEEPTQSVWLADTLQEARLIIEFVAPGLVRFPRQPADDRKIVETWL